MRLIPGLWVRLPAWSLTTRGPRPSQALRIARVRDPDLASQSGLRRHAEPEAPSTCPTLVDRHLIIRAARGTFDWQPQKCTVAGSDHCKPWPIDIVVIARNATAHRLRAHTCRVPAILEDSKRAFARMSAPPLRTRKGRLSCVRTGLTQAAVRAGSTIPENDGDLPFIGRSRGGPLRMRSKRISRHGG